MTTNEATNEIRRGHKIESVANKTEKEGRETNKQTKTGYTQERSVRMKDFNTTASIVMVSESAQVTGWGLKSSTWLNATYLKKCNFSVKMCAVRRV